VDTADRSLIKEETKSISTGYFISSVCLFCNGDNCMTLRLRNPSIDRSYLSQIFHEISLLFVLVIYSY